MEGHLLMRDQYCEAFNAASSALECHDEEFDQDKLLDALSQAHIVYIAQRQEIFTTFMYSMLPPHKMLGHSSYSIPAYCQGIHNCATRWSISWCVSKARVWSHVVKVSTWTGGEDESLSWTFHLQNTTSNPWQPADLIDQFPWECWPFWIRHHFQT